MANPLDKLEWQGNSKQMYHAIFKEIPPLFAGSVKKRIIDWIIKNNIRIVTEDIVFKAVKDIAPAGLANHRIIPELKKLRSDDR